MTSALPCNDSNTTLSTARSCSTQYCTASSRHSNVSGPVKQLPLRISDHECPIDEITNYWHNGDYEEVLQKNSHAQEEERPFRGIENIPSEVERDRLFEPAVEVARDFRCNGVPLDTITERTSFSTSRESPSQQNSASLSKLEPSPVTTNRCNSSPAATSPTAEETSQCFAHKLEESGFQTQQVLTPLHQISEASSTSNAVEQNRSAVGCKGLESEASSQANYDSNSSPHDSHRVKRKTSAYVRDIYEKLVQASQNRETNNIRFATGTRHTERTSQKSQIPVPTRLMKSRKNESPSSGHGKSTTVASSHTFHDEEVRDAERKSEGKERKAYSPIGNKSRSGASSGKTSRIPFPVPRYSPYKRTNGNREFLCGRQGASNVRPTQSSAVGGNAKSLENEAAAENEKLESAPSSHKFLFLSSREDLVEETQFESRQNDSLPGSMVIQPLIHVPNSVRDSSSSWTLPLYPSPCTSIRISSKPPSHHKARDDSDHDRHTNDGIPILRPSVPSLKSVDDAEEKNANSIIAPSDASSSFFVCRNVSKNGSFADADNTAEQLLMGPSLCADAPDSTSISKSTCATMQPSVHMPSPLRPRRKPKPQYRLFPPAPRPLDSPAGSRSMPMAQKIRSLSSMLRVPSATMRASKSSKLELCEEALLCAHGKHIKKPTIFTADRIGRRMIGPKHWFTECGEGCYNCTIKTLTQRLRTSLASILPEGTHRNRVQRQPSQLHGCMGFGLGKPRLQEKPLPNLPIIHPLEEVERMRIADLEAQGERTKEGTQILRMLKRCFCQARDDVSSVSGQSTARAIRETPMVRLAERRRIID